MSSMLSIRMLPHSSVSQPWRPLPTRQLCVAQRSSPTKKQGGLWKRSPASWSDFCENHESVAVTSLSIGVVRLTTPEHSPCERPVCGGLLFFRNPKGLHLPDSAFCHGRGLEIDTMPLL